MLLANKKLEETDSIVTVCLVEMKNLANEFSNLKNFFLNIFETSRLFCAQFIDVSHLSEVWCKFLRTTDKFLISFTY